MHLPLLEQNHFTGFTIQFGKSFTYLRMLKIFLHLIIKRNFWRKMLTTILSALRPHLKSCSANFLIFTVVLKTFVRLNFHLENWSYCSILNSLTGHFFKNTPIHMQLSYSVCFFKHLRSQTMQDIFYQTLHLRRPSEKLRTTEWKLNQLSRLICVW